MRVLVAGTAVLAGVAAGLTLGPSAHAAEGLDTTATTTYTVDFAAGVVRAQLELSFANSVPDEVNGNSVRSTVFRGIEFGVQGDAAAVTGRAGGQPLDVSLLPVDAEIQRLAIAFPDNLDYGERQDVVVTYDLPGLPPRSEQPWRANQAFAAFIAYAYGDPGAATVRIVTPSDATLAFPELSGTSLPSPEVTALGDVDVYTFPALAEPTRFAPAVIAADDGALTETVLAVNGREVVLQAWPDDPEWAGFVGSQITAGLTELEALIGLPIRDERRLVVRESVNPILEGFAGWFDNRTGVIEIGEDLDPGVMFHELGHAWFNDDASPSRWITEGLAETYANVTLERTGGTALQPEAPALDGPGAQPLADWRHPDGFTVDDAVERYGYGTSFFVVNAVVDEVGIDAMRDVLAAVEGDLEAYRGEGDPQPVSRVTDWRRLLDLVEQVGSSRTATELFRTYVVAADEVPLLDERNSARTSYADLVADGAGWAAPDVLRDAMESWEFGAAETTIDEATAVLTERITLLATAGEAGIDVPTDLETRYESAQDDTDLRALADDVMALTEAVDSVRDAAAAAGQPRTALEVLGLAGADFGDELAAARAEITAGDPAAAADLAAGVVDELAGATAAGQRRADSVTDTAVEQWWVAAVAVAGGLLLAALVTLARRRRSGGVGAQLDPGRDAAVDADVELGVGRRVDLDEDALTGARLGGVDGVLHAADRNDGQRTGTARVVEGRAGLPDVSDPVLELHEDVRAVIDAQAVSGAEILVDPDAHGGPER